MSLGNIDVSRACKDLKIFLDDSGMTCGMTVGGRVCTLDCYEAKEEVFSLAFSACVGGKKETKGHCDLNCHVTDDQTLACSELDSSFHVVLNWFGADLYVADGHIVQRYDQMSGFVKTLINIFSENPFWIPSTW